MEIHPLRIVGKIIYEYWTTRSCRFVDNPDGSQTFESYWGEPHPMRSIDVLRSDGLRISSGGSAENFDQFVSIFIAGVLNENHWPVRPEFLGATESFKPMPRRTFEQQVEEARQNCMGEYVSIEFDVKGL